MNALLHAVVTAAACATNPPACGGATPVIAVGSINPTTTLLVTPARGQIVLAIEVNGLVLIPSHSPTLAVPLVPPNALPAGHVQLLAGPR